MTIKITLAEWFKLPLKLREKWWRETAYDQREPSEELRREVDVALAHRSKDNNSPMDFTPEVRSVLTRRDANGRVIVAIDCDLAPVGSLLIVTELVLQGYMVFLERTVLPDVITQTANVDIYQLTARGIALCEANGIKQQ